MELKVVSQFRFKSTTVRGELCNNTVTVFDTGVTHINKRILSKRVEKLPKLKVLCSKFGYHVLEEGYAIKFSSLMLIASNVAHIVKENDMKDLL